MCDQNHDLDTLTGDEITDFYAAWGEQLAHEEASAQRELCAHLTPEQKNRALIATWHALKHLKGTHPYNSVWGQTTPARANAWDVLMEQYDALVVSGAKLYPHVDRFLEITRSVIEANGHTVRVFLERRNSVDGTTYWFGQCTTCFAAVRMVHGIDAPVLTGDLLHELCRPLIEVERPDTRTYDDMVSR
jgi:hypothetical protein